MLLGRVGVDIVSCT